MGASATESMQVTIKLIPLGHDEEENHRVIKLNNEIREAAIGRASKNAHKGLLAGRHNAWFDYPILSRTHAKFTASLSQQEIFVEDCGSTHGTFLEKRKLEAGIPYIVADGEIITFGQRVTSGAVTYPAKDFRIHSNWDLYSHETSSVFPIFSPRPLGFHVPEEGHDSSDPSREGSVQVIESHPRTYSIPSSSAGESESDEDDEVEIASSVQSSDNKVSTTTTPDHRAALIKNPPREVRGQGPESVLIHGDVRGLNLKGPSLQDLLSKPAAVGTSQHNPIDLEGASALKKNAPDIESDEDGPEILPIHHMSPTTSKDPVWKEPQLVRQRYHPHTGPANLGTQDQAKRIILETQARISKEEEPVRQQSPELPIESAACATDGFDTEDDDGFDNDDDFSDYDPEKDIHDVFSFFKENPLRQDVLRTAVPIDQPSLEAGKTEDQPSLSNARQDVYGFPYQRSSTFLSMSEGIDVSQPLHCHVPPPPFSQRAPSPSDAALARKVRDPKSAIDRSVETSADFTSFAPLNGSSSRMNRDKVCTLSFSSDYSSYPELKTPEPSYRPYEQGPFSTRNGSSSAQQQSSWAMYGGAPPAPEPSHVTFDLNSYKANHSSTYCSEARKASDGPYSKINISSIVNAPSETGPTNLKRKAEHISPDDDTDDFAHAQTLEPHMQAPRQPPPPSPYSGSADDTEITLHDAQARDVHVPVEATALSQDNGLEPIVRSTCTTAIAKAKTTDGPPRKKAKTSSSSSGVIQFVSGVCLGLGAAVAAFVATIPSGVREEALRELANAT